MRDHTVGLSCSKAQFSQHCIDIKTKQKRDQAKKYFSYFDRPKSFINDGDDAEECSLCSFIFIFYFFFYGRRQQSDFCFAAETRIKQRAITKKTDNKTISRRLGMFLFFWITPLYWQKKMKRPQKPDRFLSPSFFIQCIYRGILCQRSCFHWEKIPCHPRERGRGMPAICDVAKKKINRIPRRKK